LSNVLYVLNKR